MTVDIEGERADEGVKIKVKSLSLSRYVEEALKLGEYHRDEDGVVIGKVPGVSGFFAQGDSFEEARENLKDVIEGNVLIALQMGIEIPRLKGVKIKEEYVEAKASQS